MYILKFGRVITIRRKALFLEKCWKQHMKVTITNFLLSFSTKDELAHCKVPSQSWVESHLENLLLKPGTFLQVYLRSDQVRLIQCFPHWAWNRVTEALYWTVIDGTHHSLGLGFPTQSKKPPALSCVMFGGPLCRGCLLLILCKLPRPSS
jgi:hypothetical protein